MMRCVKVEALAGGEILAKNIFSQSGTVLMSEGTKIRSEYAKHLMNIGIEEIYVEDEFSIGVRVDEATEKEIKNNCQKQVKNIIDRFFSSGNSELEKVQEIAVEIISNILEKKELVFILEGMRENSETLYSHPLNVCAMSVFVALKMELPKEKILNIAEGCLLHDIGYQKVYVEEGHKKTGEFTEHEKQEIKKHVIYGYEILQNEAWLSKEAKEIVLHHHERWDGSGYPMHLKGERIRKECLIVGACDVFDCMVYGFRKKRVKIYKALDYLKEQAGILFDEKVVRCMLENIAAYPNGSLVVLDNGDNGIVLHQNESSPSQPVVRLLTDKEGKRYEEWLEVDLAEKTGINIVDTVEYL